jgi:RHS repeat-associated protein
MFVEHFSFEVSGRRVSITLSKLQGLLAGRKQHEWIVRRSDGYCYDAAGNLLDSGGCANPHFFTYDAENRVVSVNHGVTNYIYDGDGRRVEKSTPSTGTLEDYIFDKDDNPIQNVFNTAVPYYLEEYIDSWHFATYLVNASHNATTLYFHYNDWLGTGRARADVSGTVCETITSLPYGDGQSITGSCGDVSPMHFSGKERDAVNIDNFGARYYSSPQGRFMTPDWAVRPEPVPYAQFDNPQTLDLYSYVIGSPVTHADDTGHYHCDPDTATWGPNGVTVTAGACHSDWWDFQWLKNLFKPQLVPGQSFEQYLKEHTVRAEIPIGPGGFLEDLRALTTAEELMRARPPWANSPGGFVNWLKNLQKADVKLTNQQADAIINEAKTLNVEVRLDPPHPGTAWNVPHLNIGNAGQVHLEVAPGYSNPGVFQGHP